MESHPRDIVFVHHLSTVFSSTLVHPPKRAFSNHLQHVVLFHDNRAFRIPQKEGSRDGDEGLLLQGQLHTSGRPGSGREERLKLAALPFPLFHNNPGLINKKRWRGRKNEILEQSASCSSPSLSPPVPHPNLVPTRPWAPPFPLHPASPTRPPPPSPRHSPRPRPLYPASPTNPAPSTQPRPPTPPLPATQSS